MMRRFAMRLLVKISCLCLLGGLAPMWSAAAPAYETDYDDLVKISGELHQALEGPQRAQCQPKPVFWDQVAMPYVQPGLDSDSTARKRAVHLSAGFLNLLVHLSHAKALDAMDRGYFRKYLATLAAENGEKPLGELPGVSDSKAWSFDVMNHQVSYFNQMAGALLAINLAHHYLGHYDKYASRLKDAQNHAVPLNSLITAEEWRAAVLKGARNALDCGLGIDGLKVILESLEQMPTRPPWAIYLAPAQINPGKLRKELEKMEKTFFMAE